MSSKNKKIIISSIGMVSAVPCGIGLCKTKAQHKYNLIKKLQKENVSKHKFHKNFHNEKYFEGCVYCKKQKEKDMYEFDCTSSGWNNGL